MRTELFCRRDVPISVCVFFWEGLLYQYFVADQDYVHNKLCYKVVIFGPHQLLHEIMLLYSHNVKQLPVIIIHVHEQS